MSSTPEDLRRRASLKREMETLGESGAAIRQGVENARAAFGYSLPGLLRTVVGDEGGLAQIQEGERIQQEAAEFGPRVQSVEQVQDVGSGLEYARNLALTQLPNIATAVTGAGLGAVGLRTLAQQGVKRAAAGAAARVAEQAGAKTVSRELQRTALREAREGAVDTLARRTQQGALGGAALTGTALQTGETAGSVTDTEAQGDTQTNALLALGGAALGGSLETIPALALLRRYGVTGKPMEALSGGILKRMGKAGAKQAVSEGGTEVAQQAITTATHATIVENPDVLGSDEALSGYFNALVGGALGGFIFGAPAGIRRGAKPPAGDEAPDNRSRWRKMYDRTFSARAKPGEEVPTGDDVGAMFEANKQQVESEKRFSRLFEEFEAFAGRDDLRLNEFGQGVASGSEFANTFDPRLARRAARLNPALTTQERHVLSMMPKEIVDRLAVDRPQFLQDGADAFLGKKDAPEAMEQLRSLLPEDRAAVFTKAAMMFRIATEQAEKDGYSDPSGKFAFANPEPVAKLRDDTDYNARREVSDDGETVADRFADGLVEEDGLRPSASFDLPDIDTFAKAPKDTFSVEDNPGFALTADSDTKRVKPYNIKSLMSELANDPLVKDTRFPNEVERAAYLFKTALDELAARKVDIDVDSMSDKFEFNGVPLATIRASLARNVDRIAPPLTPGEAGRMSDPSRVSERPIKPRVQQTSTSLISGDVRREAFTQPRAAPPSDRPLSFDTRDLRDDTPAGLQAGDAEQQPLPDSQIPLRATEAKTERVQLDPGYEAAVSKRVKAGLKLRSLLPKAMQDNLATPAMKHAREQRPSESLPPDMQSTMITPDVIQRGRAPLLNALQNAQARGGTNQIENAQARLDKYDNAVKAYTKAAESPALQRGRRTEAATADSGDIDYDALERERFEARKAVAKDAAAELRDEVVEKRADLIAKRRETESADEKTELGKEINKLNSDWRMLDDPTFVGTYRALRSPDFEGAAVDKLLAESGEPGSKQARITKFQAQRLKRLLAELDKRAAEIVESGEPAATGTRPNRAQAELNRAADLRAAKETKRLGYDPEAAQPRPKSEPVAKAKRATPKTKKEQAREALKNTKPKQGPAEPKTERRKVKEAPKGKDLSVVQERRNLAKVVEEYASKTLAERTDTQLRALEKQLEKFKDTLFISQRLARVQAELARRASSPKRMSKATPSEVTNEAATAKLDELLPKLKGVVDGLTSALGLDAVTVQLGSESSYDPKTRVLTIDKRLTGNRRAMVETLYHEVGHVVMEDKFAGASDKVKAAITKDFEAWREANKGKPKEAWVSRSPKWMGELVKRQTNIDPEYALDFHEYMADNIAKALLGQPNKKLSMLDNFFVSIADSLRKLYSALSGSEYRATPSVQSWVDDMLGVRKVPKANHAYPSSAFATLPPEAREILEREFLKADVFEQIMEHMSKNNRAFTLENYSSQFEALINVGVALHMQGKLKLRPQARGHFRQALQHFQNAVGMNSNTALARTILADLKRGRVTTDYDARAARAKTGMQQASLAARRFFERVVVPPFRALLSDIDERVRKLPYAQARQIAAAINQRTGEVGAKESLSQAIQRERNVWLGEVFKIVDTLEPQLESLGIKQGAERKALKAKNEAAAKEANDKKRRLLKSLQEGSAPDADVAAEHAKIRALLDRFYGDYMNKAVVTIDPEGNAVLGMGRIENYFPVVTDPEAVRQNEGKMRELLMQEKFKGPMAAYFERMKGKNPWYEEVDLTDQASMVEYMIKMARYDSDSVGDNAGRSLTDEKASPGLRAAQPRVSSFIYKYGSPEDKATFATFQSKDLTEVLIKYFASGVKRAEYDRRFTSIKAKTYRKDGQEVTKLVKVNRISKQLKEMKEAGATEKEIQLMRDYVDSAMGNYNQRVAPLIQKLAAWSDEYLNTEIGELNIGQLRTFNTVATTYQNFRLLTLAAISSFVDPLGSYVRGGSASDSWDSFREALRSMRSKDPDVLRQMAEDMGVIEKHSMIEAMSIMYGGSTDTNTLMGRANNFLFKYNGLEYVTRLSRMAAFANAHRFLLRHAKGVDDHSARYLKELGLTPVDIVMDERGFVKRNEKVDKALFRFVDEAVLRPKPTQRPLWQNDPNFAIIAQYKGFLYSLYNTIVRRMLNEVHHGNYRVVLALVPYIGVTMAVEALRELLQHGPEGDPMRENWGILDYTMLSVDRTGLLGPKVTAFADAEQDNSYGSSVINSMAGPTAQQVGQWTDAALGERGITRTAVEAVPASTVFEDWFL